MRHPFTRSERRFVRDIARLRYNAKLRLFSYYYRDDRPENNRLWNRGGKQCEAHGNRCMHCMVERYERRTEIKALRRSEIIWE